MKSFKRIFALCVLMLVTSLALAAGEFKDINSMMKSGDWRGAENALVSYIKTKPTSAKANYLLAQTYEQQNRIPEASATLQKALNLDPSAKFASSMNAVNAMNSRLNDKMRGPVASKPKQQYYDDPSRSSNAVANQPYRHTPSAISPPPVRQETAAITPVQTNTDNSGSGFGTFLVFLLILIALGVGGVLLYKRWNDKKQAEVKELERKNLLARCVAVQGELETLSKNLKYENQASSELADDVAALMTLVSKSVAGLSSRNYVEELAIKLSHVVEYENQIANYASLLRRKDFNPSKKAKPSVSQAIKSSATPFEIPDSYQTRPAAASTPPASQYVPPVSHQSTPAHHTSHTVVHEHHNSGPDLLTTVLVANAISSNNNHSHDYERQRRLDAEAEENRQRRREEEQKNRRREEEREEERRQEREAEREYSSRSYTPPIDLGGNDDDDDSSSSRSSYSAPEIDYGNNDSDNDTSSSSSSSASDDDN